MTRETKLGIGVSTALLVLVAAAVARAWLGGGEGVESDPQNDVARAAPEPPSPAGERPEQRGGKQGSGGNLAGEGNISQPAEVVPADFKLKSVPGPGATQSGDAQVSIPNPNGSAMPAGPPPVPLPAGPVDVPPPPSAPEVAAGSGWWYRGGKQADATVPGAAPPGAGIDVPLPGPVNVAQNDQGGAAGQKAAPVPSADVPLPPGPPPAEALPGPTAQGTRKGQDGGATKAAEPTVEELLRKAKTGPANSGPPPVPPPGSPAEAALPAPPGGPAGVPGNPAAPPESAGTLPAPPADPGAEGKNAEGGKHAPGRGAQPVAGVVGDAQQSAGGPAGPGGLPAPPPVGQLPSGETAGNVVPPNQRVAVPMPPPAGGPGQVSVAMNNNGQAEKLPVLGGGPAAGGPTIRVSGPSETQAAAQAPQVRDYYDEPFRCTPDVRTFEAIAKKQYGSERYARALLLYNRDYNPALPPSENTREDTNLPTGQKVVMPPASVLEDRFAAAVRDYQPARQVVAAAPAARGQPIASTPVAPSPPGAPAAAATAAANIGRPAAAATVSYQVQGGGEMLWQIARDRLGDAKRWVEIYRLNPDIQPAFAIPAGTVLRLPQGARVGP
jgi:hypothetical protein